MRDEGRLKGRPGFLDYDFLDSSMNDFYAFVSEQFSEWFYSSMGLNNASKWAYDYLAVFNFYYRSLAEIERLSVNLRTRMIEANHFVIDTMRQLSALFESGNYTLDPDGILSEYRSSIVEEVARTVRKIEVISLTKEVIDWNR